MGKKDKNEYDNHYEQGKSDYREGKRSDKPYDEHAWTMWKSEDTQKHEHKSNQSYDEGRKDAGEKDSTCFVTTACVHFAGLPDDCFQMTMSRKLRDDFLRKDDKGVVFLQDYIKMAPRIVSSIELHPDREIILHGLFSQISEVANKVNGCDFEGAFNDCKRIFSDLCAMHINPR